MFKRSMFCAGIGKLKDLHFMSDVAESEGQVLEMIANPACVGFLRTGIEWGDDGNFQNFLPSAQHPVLPASEGDLGIDEQIPEADSGFQQIPVC